MKRKPGSALIPLALTSFAAGICLTLTVTPMWYGLIAVGLSLAALLIGILMCNGYSRGVKQVLDDVFNENTSAAAQIVRSIAIPALLFDGNGRIIWTNDAFGEIYSGRDIKKLLTDFDLRFPPQAYSFDHGGNTYQVMSMTVERSHESAGTLTFQYWVDRTEALHYSRLYEEQMPTVALIYVDNYDELSADKQFHRNTVLAEVEKMVSEFVTSIEGAYRRYESARFIVIFEAKHIAELEKQRFQFLEKVRDINTGTSQAVTLSISVGAEDRVAKSDESARQGMELALGRGGDQAVVKRGAGYSFYGGKHQVTTRQSRVKTRLFAKALRQLMENCDNIYIMGHKNPDMDCVGSALGLMRCAMLVGCRATLVLDESSAMIDGAVEVMKSNVKLYHDCIKSTEQVMQQMRTGSVLIVVDTQRESTVMSPELYSRFTKTVIIDHHRRPVDALSSPTLTYLEAGASSTAEMVTEVIQYFDEELRPTSFECGALLAGITMDTKRFAFNTGARTFEAASYLRRNGADNNIVKMMFQDDMQTYKSRAQVVENALVMEGGIAISTCPKGIVNSSLIAAQSADELMSIKGIQASFVLADNDGTIMISGRSMGEINVQLVLEKLGGGGHLTVAGAQLRGVSMDEALSKLTECIKTYLKEVSI